MKPLLIILVLFAAFFRFYELNMPDVIEDEDGHVRDAVAFYHNDPSIVPRHHTFAHTKGNMGHPFFHHFLMLFSYKIFSPTNASSRLPAVIMSFISAFVVYHLGRKMFNENTGLIGASLFLLSPLVFRVSRTAHIDSTFAAMGGLSLYYFYLYLKERKLKQALLVGFFSALLFTSKINGFVIFAVFIGSLIVMLIFRSVRITRKDIIPALVSSFVFILLFLILNDPRSYLDAIIHPADPGYNSVFSNPFSVDISRLKGIIFYLFPLHFSLLLVAAIISGLKQIKNKNYRIEYTLLLVSLPLFFTGFRFGLERGLLIFLIPACVLTGKLLTDHLKLTKPSYLLIYLVLFLLFFPSLLFWGFRTKPLPIPPYDPITHYYTNRSKIFEYLNNLPQKSVTVSTLPSTLFFPGLNLRKGIDLIPVAFRDPAITDYFLTDSREIYQSKLLDNNYDLVKYTEYKDDMAALFERIKNK